MIVQRLSATHCAPAPTLSPRIETSISCNMPKSAISIASPSSEKRHHGPHEVVKSAYAYSGENHLEGERQMVGMHHRIFANPTRNLAATITPTTHTIAHVARSRMSASRLRDALNAKQHAAFQIIDRVLAK
jgi:stress-induced morphogen